ncbi:restriction endonuclease [Micromonospora sp. NPDC003776]
MADDPVPTQAAIQSAPEPATPACRIYEARRQWAQTYASNHRSRRRLGAALSLIFTLVAGIGAYGMAGIAEASVPERFFITALFPLFPILAARMSARVRLEGDTAVVGWAAAWLIAICWAALLFFGYAKNGQLILAFTFGINSLAQVTVYAACMFIPVNYRFEDEIVLPRILETHAAPPPHDNESILSDYREAEKLAAAWLRRFGYKDAEITPVGQDGGIDVAARGAVAQVKLWHTKRVGISEVQRLAGLTKPGQRPFFFARSGYTRQAEEWASDPAHRVALFELEGDGNLRAANFTALRTLYKAPFRMPSSARQPISAGFKVVTGAFFAFGVAAIPVGGAFILATPGTRFLPSLFLIGSIWLTYVLGFTQILGKDFRRLIRALTARREGAEWPGWREILTDPAVADRDEALPAGQFSGYAEKGQLGLFITVIELFVLTRKLRQWALCKVGITRRPRAPFGIGELLAVKLLMDMGRTSRRHKRLPRSPSANARRSS